jgi:sugar lactone lactonase YvrE
MKNNQSTHSLRTSLSILLLVSIVNLIASPVSFATRAANTDAARLNPFDEPTEFIRRIPLTTNDLVYSASTGKLYASIPSSGGSSGNSIAAIDPTTGVIGSSTFIGSEPNKLALSDDGHSLYVSLAGASAIRRFDVLANTPGLQFSLGQDPFFGRFSVNDLAVAPGNPDLLAVVRRQNAGVAVFDNGVRRPNVGPAFSGGSNFLAFSASASKLYGTGFSNGLETMTIDASGVTVSSNSTLAAGARIKFSNGLIFSSLGHVVNPDSNTLLGTFFLSNSFFNFNSTCFVPDASNGRAYYLTPGPSSETLTLKAFDINTFVLLGSLNITGVNGSPTSLVRWGSNGLAFGTDSNQLFIIQTSLIPSAEAIPTPTPTPSPVPSPSPSPAAAFVREIGLSTNNLIYSQATQKLYASVPSNEGSTGNSVAEIDPVLGSISNQTFVGSEPTQLAQADDGQTLYVGLDGAASIRSYNILSHTAGAQFSVGRDNSFGPYSFSDIAVSPGNPSVVAVARQFRGISPSEAGVAIFDGGVQRVKTGPGHIDGSDFLAFASPSLLYGNNFHGISTMTVDSPGVTVTGTTNFSTETSLTLDNNLLYGSSGQVLNPSTGELVGTFPVGFFASILAVDSANSRVFLLSGSFGGGTLQLRAFDINTFLPIGFVNISGVTGVPRDLVRWGTNGLAFRTTNRQVFLIETALVNPNVPVATPTPTPSPTPSPSPAYIPTFVRQVNLPANNLVYSEATQALYASVPSTAGASGNSITKITPETGAVGPSTFIGSEPNKMAISTDGQTLYAHLDGANAARRFEVASQTPGLQFSTSSQPPQDMRVVPGSPQSLVISSGNFSSPIVIYDNGVQRPNTGGGFSSVGPIDFGANASILYSSSGSSLVRFLVDSSGVTTPTATALLREFATSLKFSNGLLYSSSGRVLDPEALTLIGTFQGTGFSSPLAVDAANHRVFYAMSSGSNVEILGFDSNTFLPIGSVTLPGVSNTPINLVRWGTNGLALNTFPSLGSGNQVYLLQTELVSTAGTVPTGLQFEVNNPFTFEGAAFTVKVLRTGDVSGSVSIDYATSDGTATAGSDYTATSGTLTFAPGELSKTISIPITNDNLYEGGNETFTLTLSSPTGSAILTTPSTTITISDTQSKPSLFISSDSRISEGDAATKNAAFKFTLTNASFQAITVDYATANGTATAGSDYVAASGTLTIPAGTTSGTINIVINGDTTIEPDETFFVNLSNPTNLSSIFSPHQDVTIANDDATVQLSSAASNVNEGAGFATVTVTRVGDIWKEATVRFATTDTAGLQNCTLANGKASERCDYGTTVGTLQFGFGETTTTFTIPIVDDALVEGDETFAMNLSGPTGALLGAQNAATITIVDDDTTPATQNPVDGVTFFVTQQYIDFLGRLPDSIGLANWTDTLGNCPNGGFGENLNPGCDRVHVSAGFFLSEEFRGRGYFAYKFYEVGFDRRPAYAEFVPDMAEVGGAQSPASEVLSKAAYTDAFVQRQEFKNRYDALSNSDYVNALEINAEVTLANKAALIDALNLNQKTRAQVLREIVELQTVTDKFFVRAFVAMQYFGYLRRDPDTIGYDNWITALTADPGNFRHMIFGFIFSDEYRHRFGP